MVAVIDDDCRTIAGKFTRVCNVAVENGPDRLVLDPILPTLAQQPVPICFIDDRAVSALNNAVDRSTERASSFEESGSKICFELGVGPPKFAQSLHSVFMFRP